MTLIFVILAILAVFRLTHFLKYDEGPFRIVANFRARLSNSDNVLFQEVLKAILCVYCSGLWLSIPIAFLVLNESIISKFILLWLGISGGQAFIQLLIAKDE